MAAYRPRLADQLIRGTLDSLGAVLIEGARAVGKTTSGLHQASSSVRLDSSPDLAELANLDPGSVLAGPTPRLIDEWQLAPNLWNALRHEVDRRQLTGQFLLAGSSTPTDDVTRHSGAGRIGRVRMRTLSLTESGESLNLVSLRNLLSSNGTVGAVAELTVTDYANLIARGGWPQLVSNPAGRPTIFLANYLDDIARVDLQSTGVNRDPVRMGLLMRAIARNLATEASQARLARETGDADPLNPRTVANYLADLTRIFVLEEQPAWAAHLRSAVRQRVSPKWHFVDPSLAVSLLGADSKKLLSGLNTFGLFFESLVVRDLRIYGAVNDASVFHYRDASNLEVDAIVEARDGRWIGIEVKLGGETAIDEAARNLLALRDKLSEEQRSRLAALVVVTAGKVAMSRPDGVHVVPLGVLGP